MNLADAIRQAAQRAADSPLPVGAAVSEQPPYEHGSSAPATETGPDSFFEAAKFSEPAALPELPATPVRSGNVVRLELFLGPEQLNGLFRAMIGAQHTMMTLREAAGYVRVHPKVLEKLAKDGDLPAILIDGRWRFSKSSIDEWLTMQKYQKGGKSDVA